MKTIDERETQKTTTEKQTKKDRSKENISYSERVRAKWFRCASKLGFLQLIRKAFLIFKSNLELALSILLKERHYMNQNMLNTSIYLSIYLSIHLSIYLSIYLSI